LAYISIPSTAIMRTAKIWFLYFNVILFSRSGQFLFFLKPGVYKWYVYRVPVDNNNDG